jgi:hypothetical protein
MLDLLRKAELMATIMLSFTELAAMKGVTVEAEVTDCLMGLREAKENLTDEERERINF